MKVVGEVIKKENGKLIVPKRPIVPLIDGDGIGPDVTRATTKVIDATVNKAYDGDRSISWLPVLAGKASAEKNKEFLSKDPMRAYLPQETIDVIAECGIALKGPLETPKGGGIRSLNVALRQIFDLYVCMRPVKYFEGVPGTIKDEKKVDMIIFRENTDDLYLGIEWPAGSEEAKKVISFLKDEFGIKIREDSGIGIKPMSEFCTKRLVRTAIRYAIDHNLPSVTLVGKSNIMKFTEGAFVKWGYEVAKEFEETITEKEINDGKASNGKVVIKDVIMDNMLQQIKTRPEEYSVIATSNVNGDYLSDACIAMVGGLGIGPGANIGDNTAIFEAVHGTAPKYAGQDKVNPSAVLLSGVLLLEYIGWKEAASLLERGIRMALAGQEVTYDIARTRRRENEYRAKVTSEVINEIGILGEDWNLLQNKDPKIIQKALEKKSPTKELKCSEFAEIIMQKIREIS